MEQSLDTRAATLTKRFCTHLAATTWQSLSPAARRECRRGVLDWLGCALAGSTHREVDVLLSVYGAAGGRAQATVLGRDLRLGVLEAPVVNGQMGHLLDYDDTHMGGVVLHASSPVLAALFALAERKQVSGAALMLAYAVGFEAGVRVGRTAPDHHDGGWHLTGTLGTIAAGAAASRLLGLDAQQTTYALAIAATQAAGMQQNRGTMCKSFHAGKAASNGVLAALLAEKGFDGTQEIVEGGKGFGRIYSRRADPDALLADLDGPWMIESNGHKPYACGVLLHPLIDAMVEIRRRCSLDPAEVSKIELTVHPLVLSITGVSEPSTGLQSKFSFRHSAAVAFIDGNARVAQYTDAKANDRRIVALRRTVTARGDASMGKDEARAVLTAGGERHEVHVPHASGTTAKPMTDEAIEAKFVANAAPVIGAARAQEVIALVERLDDLADARVVVNAVAKSAPARHSASAPGGPQYLPADGKDSR
ncbi:MAG: MmgE/PrpD family protein [Proteobacteria bacterium]|nr:MmgE/PrpD family protein [Burkholderiales bacterium]